MAIRWAAGGLAPRSTSCMGTSKVEEALQASSHKAATKHGPRQVHPVMMRVA